MCSINRTWKSCSCDDHPCGSLARFHSLIPWLSTPFRAGIDLQRSDTTDPRSYTRGDWCPPGLNLSWFSYQTCGAATRPGWNGRACKLLTKNSSSINWLRRAKKSNRHLLLYLSIVTCRDMMIIYSDPPPPPAPSPPYTIGAPRPQTLLDGLRHAGPGLPPLFSTVYIAVPGPGPLIHHRYPARLGRVYMLTIAVDGHWPILPDKRYSLLPQQEPQAWSNLFLNFWLFLSSNADAVSFKVVALARGERWNRFK